MRIILAVLLILFTSSAHAEYPLKLYNEVKQRGDVKAYFTGFGRGISWADSVSEKVNGKRLFCVPPKLGMDEPIIQSLIEQEIREPSDGKPYDQDTPVELITVKAFLSKFPCNK